MAGKRQYSDSEKASILAALDANSGNVLRTSKQLDIPRKTIEEWSKGRNQNPEVAELRLVKKGELADKLNLIAHQCADLLPDKLPEANVREIVGAMSQSIEKRQLLRGDPTSITQNSDAVVKRTLALIVKETGVSEEFAKTMMEKASTLISNAVN